MTGILAILLLALPLSPPFGEATATATSVEGGLRLEVAVEVEGTPVAVVVRGVAPGALELPPVALADRGDGRWEGIVELPIVENILLGFEWIPSRGPATVSELHTLTELGVDSAIFTLDRPVTGFDEDDDPLVGVEGRRWGWLGLAAGAAALMLLAVWTVGTVRLRRGEPEESPGDGEFVAAVADEETIDKRSNFLDNSNNVE
jgi:hypothetical protein